MNATDIFDEVLKQITEGRIEGSVLLGRLAEGAPDQVLADEPEGRDTSRLRNLVAGGAAGLLLGTRPGRLLAGKALKYSTIAGLGALAWNAWQQYQTNRPTLSARDPGLPLQALQGAARERRHMLLLKAMLMALRAEGKMDESGRNALLQHLETLKADDELREWVEAQLAEPVDFENLALEVETLQEAREAYLACLAVIGESPPVERGWLQELSYALGLSRIQVRELERHAQHGTR